MNTVSTNEKTTSTYTAEELLDGSYAAYNARTSYADRSGAQWLINISIKLTGPGEVAEDDELEETPHIWQAVEYVVRKQASALVGRAAGLSCCEAREAFTVL